MWFFGFLFVFFWSECKLIFRGFCCVIIIIIKLLTWYLTFDSFQILATQSKLLLVGFLHPSFKISKKSLIPPSLPSLHWALKGCCQYGNWFAFLTPLLNSVKSTKFVMSKLKPWHLGSFVVGNWNS